MKIKEIFKLILKNKANLIVFVISLIIFLAIVEFVNYLFLVNNDMYYVWPPNLNKTFLPNSSVMKGITGASIFTINELGYRGPMIENKEKEYRILTVGGSTTESLYLDNSETWPNLIIEKLNKTKNEKDVVVMNIGKSGHNTRDHILQLKHLIKTYEPDLVIFVVGANDMLLKLSKRWTWKPFDESSYDSTKAFSYTPVYNIKSTIFYKIYNLFNEKFNSKFQPQDPIGNTLAESRLERKESNNIINVSPDLVPVIEDYEKNLNRLIEISKENNASVLFATQPYLWKENMSKEENASLWMLTDFNGNFYTTEVMIESMKKFNFKLIEVCAKNKESQSQQAAGYSLSLKLGNNCRSKLRGITPSLSNKDMDIPVDYATQHQGFTILECAQDANYKTRSILTKREWTDRDSQTKGSPIKGNLYIFCLDLEKKIPKSLDYFYDDMHFNEKGAELVAEQFVEYIQANLEEF